MSARRRRKPAKPRDRGQAATLRRLRSARAIPVVDQRLADYVVRGDGLGILASDLARYLHTEMDRVVEIRRALQDLPSAARPTGSIL